MKRILSILVLLAVLMVCSSCGQKANSKTLRIIHTSTSPSFVTVMIKERSLLEQYLPDDVDIEWLRIDNASDERDALVTGKADIGTMNYVSYLTSADKGLPITLVSNGYPIFAKLYTANPEIASLQDYGTGTKILLSNLGTTYEFALRILFKETVSDAEFLTNALMATPDDTMITQLLNDISLGGALMRFPFYTEAYANTKLRLVADLSPIMIDNGLTGAFLANSDFYAKNPEIVSAFVAAQDAAVRLINEDTSACAKIIGEFLDTDVAAVEAVLREYPPTVSVSESAYNKAAAFLFDNGFLDNEPKKFTELPNYDTIPKID